MSKLLAILATLKPTLIAASVAFARGDMLPVILISTLLNLTQLGAKPIGGAVRPGCESAEPRSKPLTSNARNQVSGDGYGTTRDDPTFG
jgi:mannose/fructose/N-acetylgalactosamine-specific phosphotransferase system component IIC